jgi:thiosulfate reductase cytochrome b subunit
MAEGLEERSDLTVEETPAPPQPRAYSYARHALIVRITHWINVITLCVLLMSGLQIFNAHPHLYWGLSSYTAAPAILDITSENDAHGVPRGVTRIFGHPFNTTGVLGLSQEDGAASSRGFPAWITIPSELWLSMGRSWHLFFAWVLVINGTLYLAYSVFWRHLSRDLIPTWTDWRSIGRSVLDHVRFRHPVGEAATRYNILQKLAYLSVIFGLLPLMVLTGLAMSPRMDSLYPGWVDVLGGRQSARTLHFLFAWTLVLFVLVHVFEVIISGLWNNVRSMITGRYAVKAAVHPPGS